MKLNDPQLMERLEYVESHAAGAHRQLADRMLLIFDEFAADQMRASVTPVEALRRFGFTAIADALEGRPLTRGKTATTL